ncbi:DNA-processing protein DprA [Nocardioides sp. SYSU D00038]|uniref:DNA-processing protein DprA n=1 Tax=Nocardioides sp. SYSU D00038 TaxID=2812554 RepID=UPI001967C70E|nr:DNA-processing protein DprA [Nocardioides sp. SYSU D00038]
MSRDDERVARVALSLLGEPGDVRLTGLVAELGAVRLRRLLADEGANLELAGEMATRLASVEPELLLERAGRAGIRYVVPGDEEWPDCLADLDRAEPVQRVGGAPLGLWVRGPVRLDRLDRAVAVVGSRNATTYGADVAAEIAASVAHAGRVVVSGAAFGIDVAAHRGALAAGGRTVAVLACGVDRPYPTPHRPLLDHLAAEGAVVSELAPGCAPTRLRFLSRNRVIAALAGGTVVVEAAARSGALNTATWTSRLHRPLLAVPGPVTSVTSQGAHHLVRSGEALLVTSGRDVLEATGVAGDALAEEPRGPQRPRDRLDHRQQRVIEAVPVASPAPVDSIARTAGLGLVEVRAALGALLRMGLVESVPTGWRLAEAARA